MNEENNNNSNEENNTLETTSTEQSMDTKTIEENSNLSTSENNTTEENQSTENNFVETNIEKTIENNPVIESSLEKNNEEGDKVEKRKDLIIKILLGIIAVLVLIIIINLIVKGINKNTSTKGVSKLLDTKYASISCIDSECNGFMAIDGDKLSKYKVILFNVDGEKVADYKEAYNANLKETELPYAIGKDFYLTSISSITSLSTKGYNMKNKKGKVLISSEKEINLVNNYLVTTTDKDSDKMYLIDKKGKTLYSNITDIESYFNGKIIEMKVDDNYSLLNELGERFLDNYSISKIVKDENDLYLYAVIKNRTDNVYNYFDLATAKIVGESFNSYTNGEEEGTLIITKKENDKNVKYTLTKDGKQTKVEEEETNTNTGSSNLFDVFKNYIDSTYAIYTRSLYSKDQENILVENKTEKSAGIYNIKTKEYKELFKFNPERLYYSLNNYYVAQKDSKDESILRIVCTSSCVQNTSVVYDFKNNKELYRYEGEDYLTSYTEYENGFKVIGLSTSSRNYAVLDKDNNKVYSTENGNIYIIDSEIVYGSSPNYSAIIYSSKDKKELSENKVNLVDDYKNKIYTYSDDNYNYVLNASGKEIIKVGKKDYFKNIKNYYVYLVDNKLNIYNIDKDKTNTYTLKDNEKMNDASGSMISPYKETLVINNSSEKYVKVIGFNGKVIKKINNVELSKLKTNDEAEKAFLIVKNSKNNKDLYGLYVYQ